MENAIAMEEDVSFWHLSYTTLSPYDVMLQEMTCDDMHTPFLNDVTVEVHGTNNHLELYDWCYTLREDRSHDAMLYKLVNNHEPILKEHFVPKKQIIEPLRRGGDDDGEVRFWKGFGPRPRKRRGRGRGGRHGRGRGRDAARGRGGRGRGRGHAGR
eukprot:6418775-Pyramimonas_sp.AAC.1